MNVFKQKVEQIVQSLKILQAILGGTLKVDLATTPLTTVYSGTQTVSVQQAGGSSPFDVNIVGSVASAELRAISNRDKIS